MTISILSINYITKILINRILSQTHTLFRSWAKRCTVCGKGFAEHPRDGKNTMFDFRRFPVIPPVWKGQSPIFSGSPEDNLQNFPLLEWACGTTK